MKIKTILIFLFAFNVVIAQPQIKKVLFIGNSYIYVNDLPLLLSNAAQSVGDSVIYDSNCIGGYTLQSHSTNATTLQKIAQANFDFVVLQEQSQLPSFPISQVQSSVYPYAITLDSLINVANPCTETVFYMTWGRKNGDASNCPNWPPVCTYSGMDSLLRLRYMQMADNNNAIISPVGAVWRHIRNNFPGIELYDADESHPSLAGSYAAACTFYSILFRKDPSQISFISTLDSTVASNIRYAAKLVAFDSLSFWNIGKYDVNADFSYSANSLSASFTNLSTNFDSLQWNFGDGSISYLTNPIHNYLQSGNYIINLYAYKCGLADTITQMISITQVGISENDTSTDFEATLNTDGAIIIKGAYNLIKEVSVLTSDGKLIYQSNEITDKINIGIQPQGIYILNLKTPSTNYSIKISNTK
jgi:hypothetical protein